MATKRVLVYGGKGALGATCVKFFKSKNWWTLSVDLVTNDEANANVLVDVKQNWTEQSQAVCSQVSSALAGARLDAIVCVAGGWAGGNAASADAVKNADAMWRQSVWPAAICAQLAAQALTVDGLLVLPGAAACLQATPGMIGYGMAKAAVHQLTRSLAARNSGLPDGATMAAILPVTLDTPMNRKFMPNADHAKWTPLAFVAETLFDWSAAADQRPASGSLVQLITDAGATKLLNSE